jgi:hypothetical protein
MKQPKWLLDINDPTRELAHGIVQGLIQASVQARGGSWASHEDDVAIAVEPSEILRFLPAALSAALQKKMEWPK